MSVSIMYRVCLIVILYYLYLYIQINCEATYNSLISIPKTNDASLDTIRSLFKAYLSHKHFIDYMVDTGKIKLVDKDWIYQRRANQTFRKLLRLQAVLNFNVKTLYLLVRSFITQLAVCINNYIMYYYSSIALVMFAQVATVQNLPLLRIILLKV